MVRDVTNGADPGRALPPQLVADAPTAFGTDVSSEWAAFRLHPPVAFDLTLQEPRYLALVPYASATCELSANGAAPTRTRLRADAITLVEPGRRLRLRSVDLFEFLLLSFDADRLRQLGEASSEGRNWHARTITDFADPGVSALAREMRRTLLADHLAQASYLQALADALMVRLLCHFLGEIETAANRQALSPGVLARIVRRIDAELDQSLSVKGLAQEASLTRSHFSRAFQRMTGDPPQRFVMKRRVCRARDLLSAGEGSIAEVAARTGFASQAHLSTVFQKEVGTSPARYRAAFRGGSST